jgi:hypothetical protein
MEAWDEEDTDNQYLLPSRKSIVEAQAQILKITLSCDFYIGNILVY